MKNDLHNFHDYLLNSDMLAIVNLLNSPVIDINLPCENGYTPIMNAINSGCVEVVQYLVSKKADIHQNNKGMSPLYYASKCGYLNIVEYLVTKGAKANKKIDNGESPLSVAYKNGYFTIFEFLLYQQSKSTQKTLNLPTPLIF